MSDQGNIEDLQRGDAGTAKTVAQMWKLVHKGKLDPIIQKEAHQIVLHSQADGRTSNRDLADAVFDYVKQKGVFVRDPFQVETISTPKVMREAIDDARLDGTYGGDKVFSADCDGYSVYFNSLAGALGFQSALTTVKTDPTRDEYSHIFPTLLVDGEWVDYDPSTPESYPGWSPPTDKKRRWHESPIEEEIGSRQWIKNTVEEITNMTTMNGVGSGLGYGYGGGDYYGSGLPQSPGSPQNPPIALPPDPAVSSLLVPSQPSPHRASAEEIFPDEDWLYNPNSTLMRDNPTLAEKGENIMTLPMEQPYNYPYYQKPVPGVSIRNGFPQGWPWSYQVEIEPATEVLIMENDDPAMTATPTDALPAGVEGYQRPDKFYSGYLTPQNVENLEARSGGMGNADRLYPGYFGMRGGMGSGVDWYDPQTGTSVAPHITEGMTQQDLEWMGYTPYSPELEEHLGDQGSIWQDLDKWYPEPTGGSSGGPIGGKTQKELDAEDEGGLIAAVGDVFGNLFSSIGSELPALGTSYAGHYLKQQEMEMALRIQNARTEAEKARAQQEYQKAMGKRWEDGIPSQGTGLPSWVIPVGAGAVVLAVAGLAYAKS